jgi:UDP-N-acetylglucosamine--N-acetylmuramyl-(pentapeptide) pyrophosphoryl-undecaprenol N-acetylglucosamine transferase
VIRGVTMLPVSAADAWQVLSKRAPDLVIGVGGYSSGPVVALAALRGIPTLVLEQNAVPGLTNRLLARVVRGAAVTYNVTLPYFHGKGFVSGNPVRPEFFRVAARAAAEDASPRRVLIFGGSQGAHAINMAMVEAAPGLAGSGGLGITHQTGEEDVSVVRAAYEHAGLSARVEPFLYAMAEEMSAADVIVCRAGATTLAELAAAGRASILVPFPHATDDHQRKNAEVLAQSGAAMVIDQRELTGSGLAAAIHALATDTPRRERMAAAIRGFARPDAASQIVERGLALLPRGRDR